ncbi:MAG: putative lipid II flippase FtsW [Acidobacteriota bacterium]|nr:putative lipid II flippase FtsW [Blastocatellia bacterium]MDW8412263.1 putative lipid II flippase FtsW [Acidobacteriota bacterium]
MNDERGGDRLLLAVSIGLTLFGVIMVYSASAVMAKYSYNSQFYFVVRQSIAAVLGIAIMLVLMNVDPQLLRRPLTVYAVLLISILLLVVVLFLPATKGTHRFIKLLGVSFQPSELGKFALVLFLAYYLSKRSGEIRSILKTFVPCCVVTALISALVLAGKDLGTTVVIGLVAAVMMLAAGVPFRYMAVCALPTVPVLYWQLFHVAYRQQRLKAFLDPWQYARDEGFQVVQSLIAIGSGGMHGLGLGQGKQKMFYLPEAHTDFIYAVIGEELGFIGAVTVVLVFLIFMWRGLHIARAAEDMFVSLLATGITVTLVMQAFFNMSVVLSLVPAKGIPLPFISYGGSSLLLSLTAVGLLLNLSKQVE